MGSNPTASAILEGCPSGLRSLTGNQVLRKRHAGSNPAPSAKYASHIVEWLSGLKRRIRNPEVPKGAREFESRLYCQLTCMVRTMRNERSKAKEQRMNVPASLPFISALEKRLNVKIRQDNERMLLANYEKNWALNGVVGRIDGQEAKFVRYLAKKYHSFIANQI